MAWYDSLLSGANTLGNLYNAFQPAIQTGASVYNRNQQNNAIGDAVGVINQAGQQNQNTLRSVYDQGMGMVQPYNQAGTQALSSYQNLLSNPNQITNDPGYQFRVDKGNQEVTRNAAANRMLGSGNFAIALQDYGQKSATSELDSALNRQIPLMNSGLSSINTAADLGRNFAYGTVGVNQAMADATAGGMLGRSASNTGMLSDLFGIGDQNRTNQPSNPLGQVGTAANQVVNGSGGSLGNLSNSLSNLFGGGNAAAGAGALNGIGAIGGTGLGTGAAALGSGGFGSGIGATGLGQTAATTLPGMGGTTAAFEGMTSGIGSGVGSTAAGSSGLSSALAAAPYFTAAFAMPSVLKAVTGGGENREQFASLSQAASQNPQWAISTMSSDYLDPNRNVTSPAKLTTMLSLENVGALPANSIPQEVFDSQALLNAFKTDDIAQLRSELEAGVAGMEPSDSLMMIYDRTTNPELKTRILGLLPVIDSDNLPTTDKSMMQQLGRLRGRG